MESSAAKDWRSLTSTPSSRVVLDIAWNWFVIIAAYAQYLHFRNAAALLLLVVISGIHWHRLAIFGHDGAHFLFFKNKRLNDIVSNLFCFFPLGATAAGYRSWHLDHHRSVGTDRDPELAFKRGRLYSRPFYRSYFALAALGDCFGMGSIELVRVLKASGPRDVRDALGLGVFWTIVVALLALTGNLPLLAIHVLSLFTVFWVIFRIRGWAEHVGIQDTYRFDCGFFWRYVVFPHNTWCHYEHHKWPLIPCHNLPQARELDRDVPVQSLSEVFDFFASESAYSSPLTPNK